MQQEKKILLIKGAAGLGDRLLAISSAINYTKTNKRTIVVDWSDGVFSPPGNCNFFKYFSLKNIDYNIFNENLFNNKQSFYPEPFKNNPKAGIYDLYSMVHPKYISKLPIRFTPKGSFRKIYGYWKYDNYNDSVFNIFRSKNFEQGRNLSPNNKHDVVIYGDMGSPLFESEFRYHIDLSNFMKEMVEKKLKELQLSNNSIGIHVRLTDKKPLKGINLLIQKIKERHSSDHQIFLATDNSEVEKMFTESFSNISKINKYLPKVSEGGIHHKAQIDKNWDMAEIVLKESILDMWLLSKCTYLYYLGNSSFSKISACLHNKSSNQFDWNLL